MKKTHMNNETLTVAVRKSMKGKRNNVVGAPPIEIKYPTGAFTVDQFQQINPHVCKLTLRSRIDDGLEGKGKRNARPLVQLSKRFQKEGVGRRPNLYMSKAQFEARTKRATAVKKVETTAPVTTPMVESSIAA